VTDGRMPGNTFLERFILFSLWSGPCLRVLGLALNIREGPAR